MTTATSTTAAKRRDAAERGRTFRASARAAGRPLARDLDAALAEAFVFLLLRYGPRFDRPSPTTVEIARMVNLAVLVLERQGFDPRAARSELKAYMMPWEQHKDPEHVPSIRPNGRPRPPKNRKMLPDCPEWRTPIARMLEIMGSPSQQ